MNDNPINKLWNSLGVNLRLVDKATAHDRYTICENCDRFMNITKQCKECNCFMRIKVTLPQSTCPLGKW